MSQPGGIIQCPRDVRSRGGCRVAPAPRGSRRAPACRRARPVAASAAASLPAGVRIRPGGASAANAMRSGGAGTDHAERVAGLGLRSGREPHLPIGRRPASSGQRSARARAAEPGGVVTRIRVSRSGPADAERTDARPPRLRGRVGGRRAARRATVSVEAECQGRVTCEWRRLLVDSEREAAAPTRTRT
jgi:hypothetical protein